MGFAERIQQFEAAYFTQVDCDKCGIIFYVPSDFMDYRNRRKGEPWWCPGCGTRWHNVAETEEDRLKRLLEEEKRKTLQEHRRLMAEINRNKSLKSKIKARDEGMRKLRNRIALGICPCCNRNFPDLAAHMASKHPGYAEKSGLKHDDYRDALIMSACREWATAQEVADAIGYNTARGMVPTLSKLRKQGLIECDRDLTPLKYRTLGPGD